MAEMLQQVCSGLIAQPRSSGGQAGMVAMLGVLLLLMLSGLAVLGARAMATAGWLAAVMG